MDGDVGVELDARNIRPERSEIAVGDKMVERGALHTEDRDVG